MKTLKGMTKRRDQGEQRRICARENANQESCFQEAINSEQAYHDSQEE
jgi:hypothetical protein